MKKLLILVLSIMLVAGAFTAVYATDGGQDSVRSAVEGSMVVIGGDARVRGICEYNQTDFNDDSDDDTCNWDQRVRLKVTAKITGGVEVRTRVNVGKGDWDDASDTSSDVTTDYAYIHIPIGPVFVDAGLQPYNWGNKFLVWDTRVDRLAIHGHSGDITVGVFGDKLDENYGDEGFLDNDVDEYGIHAVYSANDMEAGALVVFVRDEHATMDMDGYYGDIFVNANASGVALKAELAMLGGDRFETAGEEDNPWGAFISGSMGLQDGLTAGLLLAYSQNTYSADSHFTPTVMVGTDNPSALSDFGDLGDSLLIVASVDFDATPELSVYGKIAYGDYEAYPSGSDSSSWEVDLGLNYDVAANTTYSLDAGYLSPDDFNSHDDAAIGITSKLQVSF